MDKIRGTMPHHLQLVVAYNQTKIGLAYPSEGPHATGGRGSSSHRSDGGSGIDRGSGGGSGGGNGSHSSSGGWSNGVNGRWRGGGGRATATGGGRLS